MIKTVITVLIVLVIALGTYFFFFKEPSVIKLATKLSNPLQSVNNATTAVVLPEMAIERMKSQSYPGSDLVIEQTLPPGSNYNRYIASYQSEGLKIYGLLTIPDTPMPVGGFPAIIFNHGYIPPEQYRTTERYIAYTDGFSKNGYVLFRPDYRGHGDSEGMPTGAYFSPGYTVDVLNALSSVEKLSEVNPEKIGMWGHSMGGFITMKSLVLDPEIKAAVIWGGVVGSYNDMFNEWWNQRRSNWMPSNREREASRSSRQQLTDQYGQPSSGNDFWQKISPTNYLQSMTAPVQLHHGLSDETVPYQLSEKYKEHLEKAGKSVELFEYPGADHDISDPNFSIAMRRSVEFFDKYLK